jgi:acyl transferase domain-containing protein
VHVVLEEAPSRPRPADPGERLQLLRLSARSPAALDAAAARLADHLEAHPMVALDDVAWSLEAGRRAMETRRVVVARDLHEAVRLLREPARGHRAEAHRALRPSAAFLFPGGGSQYVGMGAGLHATEPAFRAEMERGLELLRARHGLDLRDAMLGREGTDRAALEPMERQVPALFLVGHALAHAWQHRGIEPGLLLGHSLGENTAACVAGVMSFEDALGLVVLRGRLFAQVTGGAMTSVRLTRRELEALLVEGVDGGVQGSHDLADLDIAALNAPDLTVASGPAAAIAALEATLAARDVEFRRLVVPVAAHSRQLDPVLGTLRAYLRGIALSPPTIPLLSNVDGRLLDDARATDPEYWVSQLRAPVNFTGCVDTLLAGPERILVETGPGRALTSLVRQHSAEGRRVRSVLSLRHADESIADDVFLLGQLGEAWACGLSPRTAASDARPPRRVPLPTYPFESRRHFLEATVRGAEPATSSSPGKIPSVERWGVRPGFRPTKAPAPAATLPSRVWLFEDRLGLGARLRLLLEARGCEVVSILDGADEARPEEAPFSLSPELGVEGHTALVEDLVARGLSPSHVVHLWSVTPDTSHRPGSSFFHHAVERGGG